MKYKIADNGIQVLKSEDDKNAYTPYCELDVIYNEINYKFCIAECELEDCKGQYHKFIELEDEITFIDEVLSADDYKQYLQNQLNPPKTIESIKIDTIDSIGIVRREQLQIEFTYDGHRQRYSMDYDQLMAQYCKELFSKDKFINDSTLWANEIEPSLYWTWMDYDGTKGSTLVVSAQYFEDMHDDWFLREQKARAIEPVIQSEIEALITFDELESYDILKRFKELLGEV